MTVTGLTSQEVSERIAKGEVNSVEPVVSRSYKDIIVKNVCTTFNLILFVLGAILLIVGEPKNALAATAVIMEKATAIREPQKKHVVILDRPFVYLLLDTETSLPLFIGVVSDVG